MASKQSTVDYIVDQLGGVDVVTAKKMFGEYGLYQDSKLVALICDGQLFVKPTDGGRAFIGAPTEAPPYPGAKLWFLISGERWDDSPWLCELLKCTAAQLPLPEKKPAKQKPAKRKT
jgi:TfoX/Sxy family transcriptional regulator of competence genes